MRSLRVELSARLREMKKPSGAEAKSKRPWRFLEAMSFLRESIVPRGNVTNFPETMVCATLCAVMLTITGIKHPAFVSL